MNVNKYLQSTINFARWGNFNHNIVFIHFPKCAGTSISHAIRELYNPFDLYKKTLHLYASKSFESYDFLQKSRESLHLSNSQFREVLLSYFLFSGQFKFIDGH